MADKRKKASSRRQQRERKELFQGLLFLGAVVLFAILGVYSITNWINSNGKPHKSTVLIVLSPVDEEQLKLARIFTNKAKTSLAMPGVSYALKHTCGSELGYMDSSINNTIFKWLKDIEEKQKGQKQACKADVPRVMDSIIKSIGTQLEQHPDENLIVFIQLPWKNAITGKTIQNLKSSTQKIKGIEKIKKIYIFGLQDSKITAIFDRFNPPGSSVVLTSGQDITLLEQRITSVQELLQK
jgi:hypothetical protein